MTYYFSTSTHSGFSETVARVKEKLGEEGFGVLSEIDVSSKLHEKLGADFRNYLILGACNPPSALKALDRRTAYRHHAALQRHCPGMGGRPD